MKKLLYPIFLITIFITACGQSAPTWQEQYDLGVRYLSEGNYEEAIIAFTAAIEIDPKQPAAYLGRADAYIRSGESEGNFAAALVDFEEAVALDETNADAWLGLADTYIRLGDYEKAMELLQEALDKTAQNSLIAEKITELETSFSESDVQVQTEEYDFHAQVTTNGMDVDAENLTVRVRDDRAATITVDGINLQDSYLTNLSTSEENATEYEWRVEMYGVQTAYSVATACWAFEPGKEETKPITDLQHSVWTYDGDSWIMVGDAEMNYTANSITWSFSVPDEYLFDFARVNRYEVWIMDVSQKIDIKRIYTLE